MKSGRRTTLPISRRTDASSETLRTLIPIKPNGTEPNGRRARKRSRSGEADALEGEAPRAATHQELDANLLPRARRDRRGRYRRLELDVQAPSGSRCESFRQHAAEGAVERLRHRFGVGADRGHRIWRLRVSPVRPLWLSHGARRANEARRQGRDSFSLRRLPTLDAPQHLAGLARRCLRRRAREVLGDARRPISGAGPVEWRGDE